MKKILFFAFAASVMASCTTDEVLDLQQNPIAFSNVFVDNSTRAIDNSFSSKNKPKSFYVYGTTQGDEANAPLVSIFNNVEVKGENGSYNYAANFTQYWIEGNKYNFVALVNAGTDITYNNHLPETVVFTSNSNTDLLYAENKGITGQASGNGTVEFTFNHLLSKVHVTFNNTIESNTENNKYEYKVTKIWLHGASPTAMCDLTTSEKKWSKHDVNKDFVVDFGNITDKSQATDSDKAIIVERQSSATSHYSRLLIPGKYTGNDGELGKMTIKFTLETLINGQSVDIRTYEPNFSVELKPGHAYNFIITKGAPGEQIKFTVAEVTEWDKGHNGPHDVPGQN